MYPIRNVNFNPKWIETVHITLGYKINKEIIIIIYC